MKKVGIAGIILGAVLWSQLYSQTQRQYIWKAELQRFEQQPSVERSAPNITEVSEPFLTVLQPQKSNTNRPAVLVFPGGGYRQIVIQKEGYAIAQWLNDQGITACILAYRLRRDSALMDAQRAMRFIRYHSAAWNIDPQRIGVMGFSAGGHLALNVATHAHSSLLCEPLDSVGCKPNFMVLVYGVFNQLATLVDKGTPPAFLAHASDDDKAPVSQSVDLYTTLRNTGVPAEMHIYERGGHGFALLEGRGAVTGWAKSCIEWMKERGILADH